MIISEIRLISTTSLKSGWIRWFYTLLTDFYNILIKDQPLSSGFPTVDFNGVLPCTGTINTNSYPWHCTDKYFHWLDSMQLTKLKKRYAFRLMCMGRLTLPLWSEGGVALKYWFKLSAHVQSDWMNHCPGAHFTDNCAHVIISIAF